MAKKKEADFEALNSPLMRIPKINVATVRDLIDLGFTYPHELAGRSPEVLFDELQRLRPNSPRERLFYFRMSVYFAELADPDRDKMNPWAWKD